MQYDIQRLPKNEIKIKVDVPKGAFTEAYDKVLAELGKDTKVAGFRPGNVPKDVLEQQLGSGRLLNEAANFLITKHLADIFKKENLSPILNPSVSVETLSKDSPFTFNVMIVDKPKVKLGDWKKIKIKKVAAKQVTDEDVDKSIANIYEAYKKQKSNQKPEAGDQDEDAGKKFIYDAQGNKVFLKDDEKDKEDGKIDDEFAKKIGARDLLHLRELVKKDLESLVSDQIETKLEEEVFDEILKVGDVEVPDILVDDELNRILVRLNQQLEQQNKSLEEFLKDEKITLDELRAKWKPQAEKNVKITLIMDEVGKEEKVQVSKEELDNAFAGVNQANLSSDQKADLQRYLAVSIFQAKTMDLVKKVVAA